MRTALPLIAAIVVLTLSLSETNGADFRAGAAMRVITPNPLLPVSGGVGEPNAVTEKRGELTVRVMVFADEQTTVAVVGIDVLGFPSVLGNVFANLSRAFLARTFLSAPPTLTVRRIVMHFPCLPADRPAT